VAASAVVLLYHISRSSRDKVCRALLGSPTALPLVTIQLSWNDLAAAPALTLVGAVLVYASQTARQLAPRLLQRALDGGLAAFIQGVAGMRAKPGLPPAALLRMSATHKQVVCHMGELVLAGVERGVLDGQGVERLLQNDAIWSLVKELGATGGPTPLAGGASAGGWGAVLQAVSSGG
jgi:hypothetical protein